MSVRECNYYILSCVLVTSWQLDIGAGMLKPRVGDQSLEQLKYHIFFLFHLQYRTPTSCITDESLVQTNAEHAFASRVEGRDTLLGAGL